jgi:hypothetical protein
MKTTHIHICLSIGLLCGLSCLLSSCDKELLGENSGRKVAVDFSVTGNDYVDETRTSVARLAEPETTIIPLRDGLYLRATLTEEPTDQLRATIALAENQKVRLAAFRGTTSTQEGVSADYVYSGGKLIPVNNLYPLLVDENATYNFVAYSYFNETAEYPLLTNISSNKQLLWGTSGQKYISASGSTVNIPMVQKFAQAKVAISTSKLPGTPNITAVSGATIASGGNRCDLSLWDGTLVTGTAPATQAVTFQTFSAASAITSNYRIIYPATEGATTTLTIGSIAINGFGTLSNITGAFTQALLEGHSYSLSLDLKGVSFAGSNIYWDGSALTFEPAGYLDEKSFYQGVFFQWGSMVGISQKNATFQSTDMVYYPTSAAAWTATSLSAAGYAAIADIPTMNHTAAAARGTGLTTDYVTNGYALDNGGEPFNYTTRLGDICRRINSGYRLPTAEEMLSGNTATTYSNWATAFAGTGWAKGTDAGGGAITFPTTGYSGVLNEAGTSELDYDTSSHFGGGFATYKGGAVLPAAGMRINQANSPPPLPAGTWDGVGMQGAYYTSSVNATTGGYLLLFLNNILTMTGSGATGFALPIRCVKN